MLQNFDFEKESIWVYDTQRIIVARNPTYKHKKYHVIESTTNLHTWEDVKQILMA